MDRGDKVQTIIDLITVEYSIHLGFQIINDGRGEQQDSGGMKCSDKYKLCYFHTSNQWVFLEPPPRLHFDH